MALNIGFSPGNDFPYWISRRYKPVINSNGTILTFRLDQVLNQDEVDVILWLGDTVGCSNFVFADDIYYFKHEKDRTLFMMKWC